MTILLGHPCLCDAMPTAKWVAPAQLGMLFKIKVHGAVGLLIRV